MSFANLIARGYTANTVMNHFIKKYPQHAGKIKAATMAGYSASSILSHLDKNKNADQDQYLTEFEKTQKSHKENKRNAAMQAVGVLGAAGAAAGAAYGGYKYATRNKAVYPSEITSGHGGQPPKGPNGNSRQPLQITGGNQGLIPHSPNQPPAPRPPSVSPSGAVIIPPYEHDPQKSVSLIKNIKEDKRITEALASGLAMPAVMQILRETMPKGKQKFLDTAPGGFDQVIEDFSNNHRSMRSEQTRANNLQKGLDRQKPPGIREQELQRFQQGYGENIQPEGQPAPEQQMQGQEPVSPQQQAMQAQQPAKQQQMQQQAQPQFQPQQNELAPIDQVSPEEMQQEQNQELANDITKPLVEEIKGLKEQQKKDRLKDVDVPAALNNMIMTPQGPAEIKFQGSKGIIAKFADGTEKSFRPDDIEKPPEDFEEAVRTLVNMIPENEKSTAIQTAIRVPMPEGLPPVTLMKFYDGKIAWYLDVPEEDYQTISLGTYSPKGTGKTGIAEYNPAVMDSRGAAFHNLIKINPNYNKDNKGKTWGYANNDYDALMKMQDILKKMSKERVDENGKVITPKPRKKPS